MIHEIWLDLNYLKGQYTMVKTHVKHFNFHNPDKIRSGRNPANIYLFKVSNRNFRKMC